MRQMNLYEVKTHLSRLVDLAAGGEEIVIAKDGKPCARLVPLVSSRQPRQFGQFQAAITVSEDFDAPMDPSALFSAGDP